MKRIAYILLVIFLTSAVQLSAQTRFGVIGGVGFNKAKFSEIVADRNTTGWNAGVTLSVDLPAGFSLQPTLCYHQKEAMLLADLSQKMGYVELPVSIQWGPDLMLLRPLVDITPYVGYALINDVAGDSGKLSWNFKSWEGKQRLEYGLGIGGGLEVWKLQLICRYNWNFGQLYTVEGWADIKENMSDLNASSRNFEGITLSLAFFF